MATLILVHGTGVREDSYDETAKIVQEKLAKLNLERAPGKQIRFEKCLWGKKYGAKLNLEGDSIPDYHPGQGFLLLPSATSKEELDLLLWGALARDPLYEIRELARQDREKGGFGQAPLGAALVQRFATFESPQALIDLLKQNGLDEYYLEALTELRASEVFRATISSVARRPHDVGSELARALLARTMAKASLAGVPSISRQTRDGLAADIATAIAGAKLAIGKWLLERSFGVLGPMLTSKGVRNRTDLSNLASPPTGDILKYQVRGEDIRKFIADTVQDVRDDEVILLAHSLGGIACLDLLISQCLPKVKLLVTVGSQAPYLYEIDALWSLRPGTPLPQHFSCKWLNIHDPNDFLSYKCQGVFGSDRVKDEIVKSGLPFPESHSAYFQSDDVWDLIGGAIP
jgi:hypothetical protein